MSTRGAVGFRLNEKAYVAYNHYDSYPEGLGYEVVDFVNKVNAEDGWGILKNKVSSLTTAPDDKDFRDLEGVGMLCSVYDGTLADFPDDSKFMEDHLFNEYSYLVNLDNMVLECYASGQLWHCIELDKLTQAGLVEAYKQEECCDD